jgi:hypothetical protein
VGGNQLRFDKLVANGFRLRAAKSSDGKREQEEKEKRDAQIHDKGKTGDEISPCGL